MSKFGSFVPARADHYILWSCCPLTQTDVCCPIRSTENLAILTQKGFDYSVVSQRRSRFGDSSTGGHADAAKPERGKEALRSSGFSAQSWYIGLSHGAAGGRCGGQHHAATATCCGSVRTVYVLCRTVVGAARFELTTPCTQNRCATRLRHAPDHGLPYAQHRALKSPYGQGKAASGPIAGCCNTA